MLLLFIFKKNKQSLTNKRIFFCVILYKKPKTRSKLVKSRADPLQPLPSPSQAVLPRQKDWRDGRGWGAGWGGNQEQRASVSAFMCIYELMDLWTGEEMTLEVGVSGPGIINTGQQSLLENSAYSETWDSWHKSQRNVIKILHCNCQNAHQHVNTP